MEVMERGGGVCDQAFRMYSVQRYIATKGERRESGSKFENFFK